MDQYIGLAGMYDSNKISEHKLIAEKVAKNVTQALNEGMIPVKYQNDISNIMNVVLQGESNTKNKDIYDIGMSIYNKYNPKLETIKVPSGLDNQPSKIYTVPKKKEGN